MFSPGQVLKTMDFSKYHGFRDEEKIERANRQKKAGPDDSGPAANAVWGRGPAIGG